MGGVQACGGPGPTASAAAERFDPSRTTGPTVWRSGSQRYRFERMPLTAEGSGRRYRLWMAWPRNTSAFPAGLPLICMLDGNAVADTLTAASLDALARAGRAPAIVAVGPDSDLRFDVAMRAYDYTPSVRSDGPTWDDEARGRPGGGADAFLQFIAGQVLPAVWQRVAVDPRRLTLWGHSYGGLFVLHALFRRPALFARYAAADPSLWWQDGFILREALQAAALPPGRETSFLLMQGESITQTARAAPPAQDVDPVAAERMRRRRAAVAPDSGRQLVEQLRGLGVRAEYQHFAGVAHGAMLEASIAPALALATRPGA